MYIENKNGTNTELEGTPALALALEELSALRITFCFLFLKKFVQRLNEFLKVELRLSLLITPLSHTVSKAFEMSRNIPLASY